MTDTGARPGRNRKRRLLVTGAGGFVGRALAQGFSRQGWQVLALDQGFDGRGSLAGVQPVTADLHEGTPHDLLRVDVVVHTAWVTTDAETLGVTRAEYLGLNLRPLLAVLEYAARTKPDAFVFLSSSGVFAPTDGTEGLTDADSPTGMSPYAAAKRAAEALIPAALEQGTAAHTVRLGYLFGPGEVSRPTRASVSLVGDWLAAARSGQPLKVRADNPRRDWTFTPDLAPALEKLVGAPPAGHPIHLGSPYGCRDRAFATLIRSHVPGTKLVTVPSGGRMKPPMVPSDIPALRGFEWTDVPTGLETLLAEEEVA